MLGNNSWDRWRAVYDKKDSEIFSEANNVTDQYNSGKLQNQQITNVCNLHRYGGGHNKQKSKQITCRK